MTRARTGDRSSRQTDGPRRSYVRTERREAVLLLGLDRPEKHNALDEAMVADVDAVLLEAKKAPCVLVVHSVAPGMFAAGADIAELIQRNASDALRAINAGLFERLEAHPWPTIAVIDGPAFGGGCELAVACDLRVASPAARFAQPELALGITAGAGANWRLPQIAGVPLARRMLYTGEIVDADAALAAGLVDAVHPAENLLDAAVDLAHKIAERSWRALQLTKLAMRLTSAPSTTFDLVAQALLFEGEDKRERMGRFLTDRQDRRRRRDAVAEPGSTGAGSSLTPDINLPGPTPNPVEPDPRPARAPSDPVPPFRVRKLTIEDGLDLASWSQPAAWNIEDALESPEPDHGYWAVADDTGSLIGYCCLGQAARASGSPQDDFVVDVAIGIRPQLAGRGWGAELGRAAVRYATEVAVDRRLRTTVPDWNSAGQRTAEQAGFVHVATRRYGRQNYEVYEQPVGTTERESA